MPLQDYRRDAPSRQAAQHKARLAEQWGRVPLQASRSLMGSRRSEGTLLVEVLLMLGVATEQKSPHCKDLSYHGRASLVSHIILADAFKHQRIMQFGFGHV